MSQFTDSEGRSWPITLNLLKVKQVKEKLQVNLLDVIEEKGELLARIYDDPMFLADLLFFLLAEDLSAKSVDADGLLKMLASGDVLAAAADAVTEALCDFFPSAPKRATAKKFVLKAKELATALTDRAGEKISNLDANQLAERYIASASNSPASSASSPGDSPSASSSG
jgi:hypothetical protein